MTARKANTKTVEKFVWNQHYRFVRDYEYEAVGILPSVYCKKGDEVVNEGFGFGKVRFYIRKDETWTLLLIPASEAFTLLEDVK